jgi:predicted metallopeptidase
MPSPGRRKSRTRPNLSRQVRLLIRDIARRVPELAHVRADRVLVVAGEARRASRATIRPLRFPGGLLHAPGKETRKPRVWFRGRKILYVITLRPLFFRSSTAEKRIETIIHELFHASSAFDGSLDPQRRHEALRAPAFEGSLRPLVKRYLAKCPAKSIERVAINGEVAVRQWLERPPTSYKRGSRVRKRYDETQTFLGPVRMITRQTRH